MPELNATDIATLKGVGFSDEDVSLYNIMYGFNGDFDQDVVGSGALIGFIVAGGLTQIFSIILHRLKDCKSHSLGPHGAATKTHITYKLTKLLAPNVVNDPLQFWINTLSALLVGLSDQQVVTGALFLIIIIISKGASFSMFYAQYISFFTLITHAATVVSMRPYFRKYPKMTLIRVIVMLFGYSIWLFANAMSILVMKEILDSWWYYRLVTPGSDEDEVKLKYDALLVVFAFEFTLITWIYSSMVPSLFIPDALVKVRKAVATWPFKKGTPDDSIISDWIHRHDTQSPPEGAWKLIKRRLSTVLLWPAKLYCRLLIRTRSKPLRALLWLIAEFFNPWATVPFILLVLFIASLALVISIVSGYNQFTEWNFGQILPIAMVFLPFWALVQSYAEDWQAAIDDKNAELRDKVEYSSTNKSEKEKQHMLNNDLSIDVVDAESIEAQVKERSTIYRD